MANSTPLDFGGRFVGTTSSPITVSVPLSVRLSDLPDDFVIDVPPSLRAFPPPYALGSTTYPAPLISIFGDVSASFRLVLLELDTGQHFVLDAGNALSSTGPHGTATVAFHPRISGAIHDTLRATAVNLAVTIPSGGLVGAALRVFSDLLAGALTKWLNEQLAFP